MGDVARSSIEQLSLELARDHISSWLGCNEHATVLFAAMPAEAQQATIDCACGWEVLTPALAMVHPDLRETAHVLLEGCLNTLDALIAGSLSHPVSRVDAKTDAGNGAGMAVEDRLEHLERRVERLDQVERLVIEHEETIANLRRALAAAALVIAGPMTDTSGSGSPSDLT